MAEYIQLEYIESSGTQYIDTGFKPNNNTGVVFDFEPTSASAQSTAYSFFGTRSAKEDGEYFAFFKASSANFNLYWEFAELYDHIWNVANKADFTARRTVVVNGASATVGGVTKTYPARTFQAKLNMYLFADNEKGAVGYPAYMKLYSCQIYDNGTLVRDYVPAKRKSDGAVGLLDKVNNVFYGNAGTGAFIAGAEVPTFDRTAFLSGLTMGLCGTGKPELTTDMMLYNGVKLPKIQEFEGYPYALISEGYKGYYLYASEQPGYVDGRHIHAPADMFYLYYMCEYSSTVWELVSEYGPVLDVDAGGWFTFSDGTFWSNYDVLNTDNTVYLAASEPVPVGGDTFTKGYLLGAELRNKRPEREPVAYLYNGVRLPALPEYDKKAYPYAVMYDDKSLNFDYVLTASLFLTDVPLSVETIDSVRYSLMAKTSGNCVIYNYHVLQGWDWVPSENGGRSFVAGECLKDGTLAEKLKWSNYDVLDYDTEEVRLAASDPVPVYE